MMTGTLGLLMWLMMIVMLVGVAAGGITWALRRLRGRPAASNPPPPPPLPADAPEAILRRRYAAGELDRDEYLRRHHDLTEHGTDHGQ
jgi:putative membrane protein